MEKVKIRYLKNINISKWLNHYKIAQKALLISSENKLLIEGQNMKEEISKLHEISTYSHGNMHIEQWLKVIFFNEKDDEIELYILEDTWLGLGNIFGGNKKLEKLLRKKASA